MKNLFVLPAALITVGLGAPAFAEPTSIETKSETKVKVDADGDVHKNLTRSEVVTDEQGTTSKTKTKVKATEDADGNTEQKVTAEVTTDPKGLLNKTKTVATDTVKITDGVVEKTHKVKVDGKVVEETNVETPAR